MKGWRIKTFSIKYLDCIFDVRFTSVHSVGIDSPVGDHELIACIQWSRSIRESVIPVKTLVLKEELGRISDFASYLSNNQRDVKIAH